MKRTRTARRRWRRRRRRKRKKKREEEKQEEACDLPMIILRTSFSSKLKTATSSTLRITAPGRIPA